MNIYSEMLEVISHPQSVIEIYFNFDD